MDSKKIKYARFLITRCLRLKSGNPLAIVYSPGQKEFIDLLVQIAIDLGIKDVRLIEEDEDKMRIILETSSIDEIKKHPYFDRSALKEVYDLGGGVLLPTSFEKSKLNGVSEEKRKIMNETIISTQKDAKAARKIYAFPWCIMAVPTKEWASELFPNEPDALNKLWHLILEITMMDKDDTYDRWEEQIKRNTYRMELLNQLKLTKLTYKNNIGTNAEVGLPKNVIWQGTKKINGSIVNFPTYENFTSPDRNKVNGTFVSSTPLILRGNEIKKIKITYKNGKLIGVDADSNLDTLLKEIDAYDGMRYLGECAFVDFDSPINKTNMNYMSTLIDENRCCHIALGSAFPRAIPNGIEMTQEELIKAGLNMCLNHVDIMIGTRDLSIIGKDIYGNEVPIFVDGNFDEEKVTAFIKERNDK